MQSVSVTSLDIFRTWRAEDDLDLEWLIARLKGGEDTEAMRIGKAFHSAMESATGELDSLFSGEYRFDFNCDCAIPQPSCRELATQRQYGDLLVRGRVDAITGKEVTDYKSTQQFDPDRLMSGYQWRFYLDMLECDSFVWKVFVIREFGGPRSFEVRDVHTLKQKRYPDLHADCERLAGDYLRFASTIPELQKEVAA